MNKEIFIQTKIWFTTSDNETVFGDGKYSILKAIDQTGSLKKACDKIGISYRKAWGELKKCEKRLGFQLIEKKRGGIDGGNTVLTTRGKQILETFLAFRNKIQTYLVAESKIFTNEL